MFPADLSSPEPLLAVALVLIAVGLAVAAALARRCLALWREGARLIAARAGNATPIPGSPETHLAAILDAVPDPIELRDAGGRLVLANLSARGLAGDLPAVAAVRHVEEELDSGAGPRRVAWAERPLALDGGRYRLRSGREITDRIAAERALEEARTRAEAASEAKSRFLASVSHEFRTPLNGILGMAALLVETPLDAEQRTYVGAVQSSAEAFLALVEEILDFSRIEAGRIDLAAEPFEVEPLVQGVVELLAPRAQGKGCAVACFVGRDVPRMVRGDADRLRQVLFNLAGNAVKFTASGGVGIAVERGAGDRLVLSVEDTGPGIPAGRQAEIFEEFEQGGRPEARAAGTGLGLAITRRLVERMGGRVSLESEVGIGSCFRVELDLPAAASPPAAPGRGAPSGRPAVLILSGSPFDAAYLARTLAEAGLTAMRAGTLDEAAAAMARQRFDVLIADHALPGTDMRAVAGEARRHGVARGIVLLSPFERRDFGPPHAAGFDAYLIKPVRARSLFERLGTEPARAAPAEAAVPHGPTTRARLARRVLLAEDNEVNALLAVRALEKLGAVVDWARDGHEALARAEAAISGASLPFDVVLMDVHMPGLDGRAVTRRIRELERTAPTGRRCRIVAVTASLARAAVAPEDGSGFDAVLGKPFTLDALAAALDGVAPASAEPVGPDRAEARGAG